MSVRFEHYITGDSAQVAIYGNLRQGQSFTTDNAHTITSIKLLLFRVGSPGTLTITVKAVDENGHPSGAALCSGTTNGNTLATAYPYEWRTISLGSGASLRGNTKYALYGECEGADSDNCVNCRHDHADSAYSGGCRLYSDDAGSSWDETISDLMFEEWGTVIGPFPTHFVT